MTQHHYDIFGWYTSAPIEGRATSVAPTNTSETTTPGELRANFTGYVWVDLPYVVPPVVDTLAPLRASIWEAIKALRDKRVQSGGYTADGKWFHSDTFSRTQQIALVMMGAGIPAGLQWKTMDGSFVAMTQTLASQIFSAAAAQDSATFTHAEVLHAQVDASSTPASIDITAGWPAIYQPQP